MRSVAMAAGVLAAMAGAASGQQMTTVRLPATFTRPLFVTAPPGDTSRLFIVEQRGSAGIATRADIKIYNNATGTVNASPFFTITGIANLSEQGLLGMAFDPNYASNGFFYVDYTDSGWISRVVRYKVSANPDVADLTSATAVISSAADPFENHNGGWIGFGPEGYLYIAWGDGGSFCDPGQRAQSLSTLWGKMLRLDVSALPYTIPPSNPFAGGGGLPEIWAYGLRNPWRNSFDRATGDLWIADVGQDVQEEVNFQAAAIGPGPFIARNYEWDCREGTACASTSPSSCAVTHCPGCAVPAGVSTPPAHSYVQAATTHCAVTGGYVYRGCAMPNLRGTYFFADYCSATIWSMRYTGGVVSEFTNRTAELAPQGGGAITAIVSFGEDAAGEIYICQGISAGAVYKIVPRCPTNCDSSTTAPVLNVADFTCFLSRYAAQDCYANCDGSTAAPTINVSDFTCFLTKYAAGCP